MKMNELEPCRCFVLINAPVTSYRSLEVAKTRTTRETMLFNAVPHCWDGEVASGYGLFRGLRQVYYQEMCWEAENVVTLNQA